MSSRDERAREWMNRMCSELPERTAAAGFARRTCILHTKLALLRAREDGLRGRPLACKVTIANRAMWDLGEQLGRPPEPHEWTPEAWSLGIGYGADPRQERPGYDGHVVAVIGECYLLDLTLDQASRPAKNIHLRPGFFGPLPDGFLAAETGVSFDMNGSVVRYVAMPEDRGFLTAPDWTMVRAGDPLTRRLLRAA